MPKRWAGSGLGDMRSSHLSAGYVVILAILTAVFLCLQILGNQLPRDLAIDRFRTAFERDNLSEHEYPYQHKGVSSVHALAGVDHYIECEYALAIIADSHSIGGDAHHLMKRAIAPQYAYTDIVGSYYSNQCGSLQSIVVDRKPYRLHLYKTQYQHGSNAVYAILLRFLPVFAIRELIKLFTYFAYAIFMLVAFHFSKRLFLFLLPTIVLGFFLSGIQYFSTVGNGLQYLWTILFSTALIVYLFRTQQHEYFTKGYLGWIVFAAGMISNYLWFLDGHLHLLIPLMMTIVYFGSARQGHRVGKRYQYAAIAVVLFATGFLSSSMVNQIMKVMVLDWQAVFSGLWVATANKTVYTARRFDTFVNGLSGTLSGRGVKLLGVATVALFITLGFFFVRAARRNEEWRWDLLFFLGCAVVIGLPLPFIHDNWQQAARFVFVPYSLGFAGVICIWYNTRYISARR